MKVHKEIKINMEDMEKTIIHKDLVKKAKYNIEQYNERKKESIYFSFTASCSRATEWGYLQTVDIAYLDKYFIGVLGMKAFTKKSFDNKTAERVYYFESEEV